MNKSKIGLKVVKGEPLSMGATIVDGGINFAVSIPNEVECRVNLYENSTGTLLESFPLTQEYKTGHVFAALLLGLQESQDYSYMFQVGSKEFLDPYAKVIHGYNSYGIRLSAEEKKLIRGGFLPREFNWEAEKVLKHRFNDLIIYKMHVRGFTKHKSSMVKNKGTFLGVIEKIPYLKELGINCIQFMPIYEYNEIIETMGMEEEYRINYWGYSGENVYCTPKASYAADPKNAVTELKMMVKALHQNGIEVILEMNFTEGIKPGFVQDCLRYWASEYHIDGFKLTGDAVPATLLATDPILGNIKLFAMGWDTNQIYDKSFEPNFKNLAVYNDGYSVDVKRFLRGEEGQVKAFSSRLIGNQDKCGVINYITNHDGFTLMDLYSYDLKHNEANGEKNKDGTDYNYSWNCGQEGKSKKKTVVELRKKQIRNAFVTLLFSQGTPLLLAGDEFGNTQLGNNNAYCQDNEISWLDWNGLKNYKETFSYVKQLIKIRKAHPILHMTYPMKIMDYISCGFPDLSFHGTKVWYPDYSPYSRILGAMFAGNYALLNRKEKDNNFYFAFNMHLDNREFDLPSLPKDMKWCILLDTSNGAILDSEQTEFLTDQKKYEVAALSVAIFIGKSIK